MRSLRYLVPALALFLAAPPSSEAGWGPAGCPPGEGAEAKASCVTLVVEKALTAESASKVQKTLAKVDGVTDVTVSEGSKEISVTFDPAKTTPEKVVAALSKAGISAKQA